MSALRRVLYLHALVASLGGLLLAVAPRFALVTLFGQPAYPDYALVRVAGIALVTLAMLQVVLAHHLEETWWWAWAFALESGAVALVLTLHAAFGLPDGAAAWPWWGFAAITWALGFGTLWGMQRAAQEKPPGV